MQGLQGKVLCLVLAGNGCTQSYGQGTARNPGTLCVNLNDQLAMQDQHGQMQVQVVQCSPTGTQMHAIQTRQRLGADQQLSAGLQVLSATSLRSMQPLDSSSVTLLGQAASPNLQVQPLQLLQQQQLLAAVSSSCQPQPSMLRFNSDSPSGPLLGQLPDGSLTLLQSVNTSGQLAPQPQAQISLLPVCSEATVAQMQPQPQLVVVPQQQQAWQMASSSISASAQHQQRQGFADNMACETRPCLQPTTLDQEAKKFEQVCHAWSIPLETNEPGTPAQESPVVASAACTCISTSHDRHCFVHGIDAGDASDTSGRSSPSSRLDVDTASLPCGLRVSAAPPAAGNPAPGWKGAQGPANVFSASIPAGWQAGDAGRCFAGSRSNSTAGLCPVSGILSSDSLTADTFSWLSGGSVGGADLAAGIPGFQSDSSSSDDSSSGSLGGSSTSSWSSNGGTDPNTPVGQHQGSMLFSARHILGMTSSPRCESGSCKPDLQLLPPKNTSLWAILHSRNSNAVASGTSAALADTAEATAQATAAVADTAEDVGLKKAGGKAAGGTVAPYDVSVQEGLKQLWNGQQLQCSKGGRVFNVTQLAWHPVGEPEPCPQDLYNFQKLKRMVQKMDAVHRTRVTLIKRIHMLADNGNGGCDLKAVYREVRNMIGDLLCMSATHLKSLQECRVAGLVRLALMLQVALELGPKE